MTAKTAPFDHERKGRCLRRNRHLVREILAADLSERILQITHAVARIKAPRHIKTRIRGAMWRVFEREEDIPKQIDPPAYWKNIGAVSVPYLEKLLSELGYSPVDPRNERSMWRVGLSPGEMHVVFLSRFFERVLP